MLSQSGVIVIARLTFREASRRWILWVALLLGLLFLVVYAIGFNEIQKDIERSIQSTGQIMMKEMFNFFLMAGLYAVNFLGVIMAVLTSIDTISGEITSGTIQTLVSKPVRRWEILIGKWLGFTIMLSLYLLLLAGGVIAIVYFISGYSPPNMLRGLALMWLNVILLLCVSLFGGATFTTLANGVMVFGLYGVAFIGGWIEQFGSYLQNQAAINIGIVSSLIIPSEAIWRRAAYEMQSPLIGAMGFSPFSSSSPPSAIMVAYAVFYTLIVLVLAIRTFNNRDL